MSRTTVVSLQHKKQSGTPITMVTAYDYIMAQILSTVGIDVVLVGDSLGNVFQGQPTTQSVTLDHMVYHTAAVRRGWPTGFIVSDMPFLTATLSESDAIQQAGRLLQDGGADAVKIEVVSPRQIPILGAIVASGIPVMAHLGFTPQSVTQLGGYRVQGKTLEAANQCCQWAIACENQGAFSIVLELVPQSVTQSVTASVAIPVIGVGAGSGCDGQGLVCTDIVGLSPQIPRFAKAYANVRDTMTQAFTEFQSAVHSEIFPQSNSANARTVK